MGLLKFVADTLKEDLLKKNNDVKFEQLKNREVIELRSNKDIFIKSIKRHPNYYKLKYLVMDHVICNIDCMISTREAEKVLGVGRSSIARQLKVLAQEGILHRIKLSDSNRSIYYKILVSKDDAILYKDTFTRSGRKKKINSNTMSQ